MSSLYVECRVEGADPELAQTNLDGTLKGPVYWDINQTGDLNRYLKDSNDEYYCVFRYQESVKIPIKVGSYNMNPKYNFRVLITSPNPLGTLYIRTSSNNIQSFVIDTNVIVDLSALLEEGSYIQIYQLTSTDSFQIYQDSYVSFESTPISIINEFEDYSIKPNLKDDITLGNTVFQRKTAKTIVEFKNSAIIKPAENRSIIEVLEFARLNKKLVLVWINDTENGGDTLSNMPQDGGYQKYYQTSYTSSQKTGIYENIEISYQNDPINGIY